MERTPHTERREVRAPREDELDDDGQRTFVINPRWNTSEAGVYHPITPWVPSVGIDEDTMKELLRDSLEEGACA